MMTAPASQFPRMVRRVTHLKLRIGVVRLGKLLIRLVAEIGFDGSGTLPLDKRTMAPRPGVTPRNAPASLREHDVEVRGNKVTLGDVERLFSTVSRTH